MNDLQESLKIALELIVTADRELWRIAGLSLRVSSLATLIGALIGIIFGCLLAVLRFPGRRLLVWTMSTLLAIPSVVVGLLVYLLLSRTGPLGSLGLLYSPAAMICAQSLLVTPLVATLLRRQVVEGLREAGEQLAAMRARPMIAALLVLVHHRQVLATILLTAFSRAISEVGAVMIVGGNIDGFTRVMTTAIALETSKGDLPLALALGIVLLAIVGLVNALLGWVRGDADADALAWRGTIA